MDTEALDVPASGARAIPGTARAATRRRLVRVSALAGMVGGTAVISSGCSLSDVSAILSILRLLGII